MEYKTLQALLAKVNCAQTQQSAAHEGEAWHAQLVACTVALIDNRSAGSARHVVAGIASDE